MRGLVATFKDPIRRPRAIVTLATALIGVLFVYMLSMGATSQTWFCNEACHNVHADNAKQWAAGSHAKVSCIPCHYPVNLDPVRFALDRVDKLLDIYPTITGQFEMPLNKYSRIGLELPVEQCTQCHSHERVVSPAAARLIDHDAHNAKGIGCTVCHNRVAHPEVFDLTLPGNEKHEDFMKMRACFRCHSLENAPRNGFTAPGTCPTCHLPEFNLQPSDHFFGGAVWTGVAGGGQSGHAKAALEDSAAVASARAEWEPIAREFVDEEPRIIMQLIDVDTEKPIDLPPVATVSACGTCHAQSFCDDCHAKTAKAAPTR